VPDVILQEGGEGATELILIDTNKGCGAVALIAACPWRVHVPTFDARRVRDKPTLRVHIRLDGSVEA
jgi:hypothetical protein